MAREITEIQDEIISAKNERLELNELESDSKVSIYNGWAYVCAVAIHSFEVLLDLFKVEIENILSTGVSGTPQFYVDKSFDYQDGDTILVASDGLSYGYAIEDSEKKIITRASYEETTVSAQNNDKLLLIKVAKGEVGNFSPLTEEELVRFTSYLDKIKFLGTNVEAVSRIGDILIPRFTVFHDGMLPDSTILSKVNDAIYEFLENLSFDTALYVSKLFDAITDIDNITDVYIDPDAMPVQGVFVQDYDAVGAIQPEREIKRFSNMTAGYMRESTKSDQEEDTPNFSDSLIIKAE